jgi:hypothetical protein
LQAAYDVAGDAAGWVVKGGIAASPDDAWFPDRKQASTRHAAFSLEEMAIPA